MVLGPGKLVANKYRLERPLAAGGMGAVWIARHLELDVEIALKFILEQPSEEAETSRARFKREAQAAARLKSPHVAQIHDYGVEGTMPYIAMELLEGEDLATLLARSGRLPLARTLAIAQQLCRGLQVAHDAGIVHRDLKPSNVFLARMGDEHLVKILDFGIAKVIGVSLPKSARTASGAIIGSPRYMSPEQLLGIKVGPPADLWAVGMLLFEMLTAACPFENELMFDVADAVGGGPHPAASEIVPGLPAGIDAFFERALALDPKQRFASARQLAEALERVAAGEPMLPDAHPSTKRVLPGDDAAPADAAAVAAAARSHGSAPSTKPSADLAYAPTAAVMSDQVNTVPMVSVRSAAPKTGRARRLRPPSWLLMLLGAAVGAGLLWLVVPRLGASPAPAPDTTAAAHAATPSAVTSDASNAADARDEEPAAAGTGGRGPRAERAQEPAGSTTTRTAPGPSAASSSAGATSGGGSRAQASSSPSSPSQPASSADHTFGI